jgi:hypothetical protein
MDDDKAKHWGETMQDERDGMIMDAQEGASSLRVVRTTWWREMIDWRSRCTNGVSTT